MNPGQLEWTVTDHMAKFSTAEAKAIVHVMLLFFQLESSIWTKEVRNLVDSGNSSGMRLPVVVSGVLIIWWIFRWIFGKSFGVLIQNFRRIFRRIFGWNFGIDFRVFIWIFRRIFGTIERRFRRAFRRILRGMDFRVLISVWKSGPRTGKRPGLDRTGPQPQSGLRSFAISRIPGPVKDQSGPVWTSLLIGKFINILSIFRTLIY